MPTYEYACSTCGHRFDVRQSFSEDPINDCPQCGASVRRVLYPAGVIFKGSGWYATDSRKGSASHSSSSSSTTDSSSSSSSESTASEAKPDKASTPAKDTAKPAKTAAADD
ncbi:MAG TPA: FmdB family zinc ribbon protein [Thermomicrobiales bacterium]|nr:FmdB family zinc ribbon protein [Thermomicrobiales bacterium]